MSGLPLDDLSDTEARQVLTRCCGSRSWVEAMMQRRPFGSRARLHEVADAVWLSLEPDDYREAFAHHPEIGENLHELRRKFAGTAELSQGEQAGALGASEDTLLALRAGNQRYRERFGYSFIVCATGKSADEMLAILGSRLDNEPSHELAIAAGEQAKITHLRLEKLAT